MEIRNTQNALHEIVELHLPVLQDHFFSSVSDCCHESNLVSNCIPVGGETSHYKARSSIQSALSRKRWLEQQHEHSVKELDLFGATISYLRTKRKQLLESEREATQVKACRCSEESVTQVQ